MAIAFFRRIRGDGMVHTSHARRHSRCIVVRWSPVDVRCRGRYTDLCRAIVTLCATPSCSTGRRLCFMLYNLVNVEATGDSRI